MWRQQGEVWNRLYRNYWRFIRDEPLTDVGPITLVETTYGTASSRRYLEKLINVALRWMGTATHADAVAPEAFKLELRRAITDIVREIEISGDYERVPMMWRDALSLGIDEPTLYPLAETFCRTIETLLGSETQHLVGTRGGRPAFKSLLPPRSDLDATRQANHYGPSTDMIYVDKGDLDLIPNWTEWCTGLKDIVTSPQDEYPILELLQDAYYNQRYDIHVAGATVKLRHFHPIIGLTLKVKPGLHDPNYLDFLVSFEFTTEAFRHVEDRPPVGKNFMVFDGKFASGQAAAVSLRPVDEYGGWYYLLWITALIYHDLVTAKKINVATSEQRAVAQLSQQITNNNEPSWIYIPRKFRNDYHPPRVPSANPRSMRPHHVSGHPRKARRSQRQEDLIAKYEAKTGLSIMDRLKPDETYVFPYHTGPTSDAEILNLPRFIHARLQADIDRMMLGQGPFIPDK